MTAHLLILYPIPKDTAKFDRAYREEHLPYAGPKLVGATGVTTKRVVGPAFAPPPYRCRFIDTETQVASKVASTWCC